MRTGAYDGDPRLRYGRVEVRTMAKRKGLSKKIRFEVFKRDSFTCQYCGRKAPDVVLEVDHIEPVSKGGTDDILNLITSCKDCNSGKGDRKLLDSTVIDKRRAQLEELQERREQLDMLFQWYQELSNLKEEVIDRLVDHWQQKAPGWNVSQHGRTQLQKLTQKYGVDEILEAMDIAARTYLRFDEHGEVTSESWDEAFDKLPGICYNRRLQDRHPEIYQINYIRAMLRKSFYYVNESWARELLEEAFSYGADFEEMKQLARSCRNWSEWRDEMLAFINDQRRRRNQPE